MKISPNCKLINVRKYDIIYRELQFWSLAISKKHLVTNLYPSVTRRTPVPMHSHESLKHETSTLIFRETELL